MRLCGVCALVGAGGDGAPAAQPPPGAISAEAPPAASAQAAAARASGAQPSSSAAAPTAPSSPGGPEACGGLRCMRYASANQAFGEALARKPLVLAVGETHAQKGTEGIPSTTKRFTTDLLPLLEHRASDLIIELWVADPKCNKKKVAEVAERQKEVTKDQAESDQNEFVTMADRAKALGIQPHVLRPTCQEYDEILAAGPDGIPKMLAMIKRLTEEKAIALLKRNAGAKKEAMVVTYGGAMHNDLAPKPGREDWSFGRELAAATKGRYVEIDLIVPEFIKDNASWQSLPWFEHFDRSKRQERVTLFNPIDDVYALIFATHGPAPAP